MSDEEREELAKVVHYALGGNDYSAMSEIEKNEVREVADAAFEWFEKRGKNG